MNVAHENTISGTRISLVSVLFAALFMAAIFRSPVAAQTASTGALSGTVVDPSGAVVGGAKVTATELQTGDVQTTVSQNSGRYLLPLLPPGGYQITVEKPGFKTAVQSGLTVHVTDTETANLQLQLGDVSQTIEITAQEQLLNTQDSALGHVTNQQMVEGLPLVNRNYTQILALSPGVVGDVNNATDLGQGGSSFNTGTYGVSAHGGSTSDNNFQMNGVQVNDLMGSAYFSGGVPVPNPDAIQEFKVQTGQYDASYGRNGGANVDVITKGGSNAYHGDLFEFWRNDILNANDFFLNEQGQSRGVLKQNQFGFSLGGPVKKDKLFFFTSYQGTRQINGLDTSAACLTTFTTPAQLSQLGSNRTAAALGAAFGGQASPLTGQIIASDGSNISPQALALLNAKLANGNYLILSPQNGTTGLSSVTQNCSFNDDQFITNGDYTQTAKSTWSGRFFWDDNNKVATSPLGIAPTLPGFPQTTNTDFRNVSLTHTYTFTPTLLNQFVLGYNRSNSALQQGEPGVTVPGTSGSGPFSYASIGTAAQGIDNTYPNISVLGQFALGGNGQGSHIVQNSYSADDSLSFIIGKHSLRFGGGASYQQINFVDFHFSGITAFDSFTDLLLGTVLEAEDLIGLTDRAWRAWNADLYVQDNFRVTPRLSINLGLRYERQGDIGDALGRSSILNLDVLDPNPPTSGSVAGYTVASNFKGTLPAGVSQGSNSSALQGVGQNDWAPRVGFAWQLPHLDRFVLRGGYGIYYTRSTGQPFLQLLADPPYSLVDRNIAVPFSSPFTAPPASFPYFPAYSPSTSLSPITFSAQFRPPIIQEYSMSLQTQLAMDLVLEVGYDGSRGTHLIQDRFFNQALSATPDKPIRGATDDSAATLGQRIPYLGFAPYGANVIESEGTNWYNALNVSLNKRFSKGLQFLAAYTWLSDLSADNGYTSGPSGGDLIGDQNNAASRYGNEGFVRPQRFVVSFLYDLPSPKSVTSLPGRVLGNWSVSGVVTIQAGHHLSILDSNEANAFGIIGQQQDRAQIMPGCTASQLVTSGSLTHKLNNYFNTSCFTGPPVIASDGSTGFGDSSTGIVSGPGQYNVDLSAVKSFALGESAARNLQLRAEFFNAFNTPQFADPSTNAGTVIPNPGGTYGNLILDPAFGQITATSVNPRVIQLALKLNF